jgi:hypothetical protein
MAPTSASVSTEDRGMSWERSDGGVPRALRLSYAEELGNELEMGGV